MTNEMLIKALREAAQEEYLNINCESMNWEPSVRFCAMTEPVIKNGAHRSQTVLRRILLIAAVMLLIGATAMLSMADVREKVINFFVSNKDDHIELQYGFDNAGDIAVFDAIDDFLTLNLEEYGFSLKEQNVTDHSSVTVWENGEQFIILQRGDGLTNRSVDTERLEKSSVTVKGVTFDIYSEEGYYLLLWNTDKYTFSLDCKCDIESSEIIEIILSCRDEKEEAQ